MGFPSSLIWSTMTRAVPVIEPMVTRTPLASSVRYSSTRPLPYLLPNIFSHSSLTSLITSFAPVIASSMMYLCSVSYPL